MIRNGLLIISGLVLGTVVVSAAMAQTSSTRKSFAQRMAELRDGWTGGGQSQPAEKLPVPEDESGSIIPNWLGGGQNKEQESTTQQQQQRRQQTQQQRNRYVAQRNAAQQRAGSAAAGTASSSANSQSTQTQSSQRSAGASQSTNIAEGFSLPGLGGSRLPDAPVVVPQARAGSNSDERYASQPQSDENYPVIRENSPTRSATETSPSQRSSDASAPRRSPTNVVSKSHQHEMPGGSKISASEANPFTRVAQANDRAAASGDRAIDISSDDVDSSTTADAQPMLTSPIATPLSRDVATDEPAPIDEPAPGGRAENSPLRDAQEAFGASPTRRPPFGNSQFIRSPRSHAAPAVPSAARSKEAFGDALQAASGGDPSVLVSNQAPVISTDIRGPKQIMVGREAVYRVRLQNQSGAQAEGVVATIRIPSSAEVVDTNTTHGAVQPAQTGGSPTQLEWQLSTLEARGSEVLDIRLIPRESRPLELGVTWTIAPVGSRAIVEVQEPQLKIDIGGPTEVLFDKPQVFRLTLSNPGTGPAEKVRIDLIPPGGAQDAATSHAFGDLAAGESKSVEIELTAREAGKLAMKAIAIAEGGLTAEVAKEILCRKPELEVDWRGPATKYSGTPATYFFRVRNPGTAPADDVTVEVTLPPGAEFSSASEGQDYDAKTRKVTWHIGTLNPGDDSYTELKCVVNNAGANEFTVTAAAASGNLSDSKIAVTTVEAIADLKLSISDPKGPVAVGTDAIYEIHVKNRGANTARNVSVVALFSEGIEPEHAEGTTYTVTDGRVSFRTIEEIPAGREATLRIRARALEAGMHVFRAEVLCNDLEIKLAAEETTRFYADEVMHEADEHADSRDGFESAAR